MAKTFSIPTAEQKLTDFYGRQITCFTRYPAKLLSNFVGYKKNALIEVAFTPAGYAILIDPNTMGCFQFDVQPEDNKFELV